MKITCFNQFTVVKNKIFMKIYCCLSTSCSHLLNALNLKYNSNKMSTKQSSDSDVVFVKEEFRVKYTGPFPVPKDHGKNYCKCQKEDSKPTSTTTEGNLSLFF